MRFLKKQTERWGDDAVSPVVGVMLMLSVTIIIAAIVSAFAGNAISGTQKAPSANVEIHIKNEGEADNSYITITILGVSEPIATKNLKVVTSWAATDETGNVINGGNTTYAGLDSATTDNGNSPITPFSVPTGYGPGVEDWANSTYHPKGAQWGNYTWIAGTTCSDNPSSDYTSYAYETGHTGIDAMQAILGAEWYSLDLGDVVTVRVIHVPSGKVLVDQQVVVEG